MPRTLLIVTKSRDLRAELVWLPKEITILRVDTIERGLVHMMIAERPGQYLLAYGPDIAARYESANPLPPCELVLYPRGQAWFVPWAAVLSMGADAFEVPAQIPDLLERLADTTAHVA